MDYEWFCSLWKLRSLTIGQRCVEYCSALDPMRIRDQETAPRATPTNFLNNPILLKFPHALWPKLTKMKHRAPGSRATLLPYTSPHELRKGSTIEDLPSLSQGYWKLDVILRLDLFPAFNQDNCSKSSSYTTIPTIPHHILYCYHDCEITRGRGSLVTLLFIIN